MQQNDDKTQSEVRLEIMEDFRQRFQKLSLERDGILADYGNFLKKKRVEELRKNILHEK